MRVPVPAGLSNRHATLADGWDRLGQAGRDGSFDERTCRLVELAIAIGAGHARAVHAGVRQARDAGVRDDEIDQVITLAAGTIGKHAALDAFAWAGEVTPTGAARSESPPNAKPTDA